MSINEQEFEHLWEQAATQQAVSDMAAGYPACRRRRQQRRSVLGIVAVCLIGGTVLFNFNSDNRRYDNIACNRTDISNEYWLQVADDMLIAQV